MALIARPQLSGSSAAPALLALALFAVAASLAALLSAVQLPSSAYEGLPVDWVQRGAWLAVHALVGLGVACVVVTLLVKSERGR
jgi:hypothetical protein